MKSGIKKVLVFVLIMAMLAGTTELPEVKAAEARSMTEGDFAYTVSGDKATITAYNGNAGDVVVPNMLGGYSVIGIDNRTFYECSCLASVAIPEGVTNIGAWAFYGCNSLSSVTMPEGVTSIRDFTFYGCSSLSSVTIPEGVTSIGRYAFYGCSSLSSVTIPEGMTSIGDAAFRKCSSLSSVTIPEGVTSIEAYTFFECSSLSSVTIPEGVTSIGDSAFYGCSSLTGNIVIPKNVNSLGIRVFAYCTQVTGLSVAEDNAYYCSDEYGNIYFKNRTKIIQGSPFADSVAILEGVINIVKSAFCGCSSLSSVTIPEGVTNIGEQAFSGCSSLSSVTIPEGVRSIGAEAFSGCSSLSSVTIPEGVTNIGESAFHGCSSLSRATIPEGVISIEYNTFADCSSLSSVTIPDGVRSIGKNAFINCSRLSSVTIPDGVTNIGEQAFVRCSSLSSVTIPEGVTNIGDRAFYGCSSLSSVTIPGGVTNIGTQAFYGCSSLSSVTIPEGVTSIGYDTFYKCSSLSSVTIPEGVTSIENAAFCGCSSLSSVTIPEGVTSIGDNAFRECSSLSSVTIPEGVTSIGTATFYGCSNLSSVTIPEGVTSIGTAAFYECSSLSSVTIPDGVTSIRDDTFCGCSSLSSVTIPEGVTSIGESAFHGCSSLSSVTIPDGVTSIGTWAFFACSSLHAVIVPKSVTNIEWNAFACRILKDVYYRGSEEDWNKISISGSNDSLINATIHYNFTGSEMPEIHTGTVWESDIENHWRVCRCGKRIEEAVHTEDAGTVTKEPTETEKGLRTYKCSVCGYVTRTEEIAMLPHTTHIYGIDWISDATTHWKKCTICDNRTEEAAHTEDAGTVTKEPTETETGLRTYKCSVCGYVMRTEEIAVLPPSHTHAYGTVWESNATTHWKECSCGEKKDTAAHTEDAGTVTKEPTETEKGLKTYKCSVCGYATRTEEIEKHGESLYEKENETVAEVEVPSGAADIPEDDRITSITINPAFNMKDKDGDNVELDLSKIEIKAKEIYDEEGLKRAEAALGETLNGNTHYNLLDLTLLYNGKDFSNGYDGLVKVVIPLPNGHRDKTFSCYRLTEKDGTVTKEIIPGEQTEDSYIIYLEHFSEYALVAAGPEEPHTHVYSTDWKSDATGHWKECACKDKLGKNVHTQDAGTVTKEATSTETGIRTFKCSVCGYIIKTEKIAKLSANKETTNKKPSATTKVTKAQKKKNEIILNKKVSFKITDDSLAVAWNKLPSADGYDIYAVPCSDDFKGITVSVGKNKTSATIRKINGRKINGTNIYKVKVKAYRLLSNGKKQYIGTSAVMHVTGSLNKTTTNAKNISLKKKTYVLKKGKPAQIRATVVKADSKKKLLSKGHGPKLSYVSSDETTATVTATGRIKAKKRGKCTIYVRALNGISKKIKVTVK